MPKRSSDSADWKVGASKDLPIEDSDSWDGSAAEKSIFEYAGGDEFDSEKARKGFLVYNAAEPDKRGSYKLPIAHAVDGELKVPKGAIRAAASRLSQTDIPSAVMKRAKAVLAAYEKRAGIGDDDDKEERALKAKHARALARAPKVPVFKRGLYEVAQLCYMLEQLGYCHASSEYEAALEGDDSDVPEMLGEALIQFGEALKAMADEEIGELLEAHDGGDDEETEVETRALSSTDREFIAAGATPRARAWRAGIAIARAGKALSASNQEKLEDAQEHHSRALKHHREMGEHHAALGAHLDAVQEHHERATQTLSELGEHLRTARANPAQSADHLERAVKSHGETENHMGAAAEAHQNADDSHEDVGDSHNAVGRRIKAAQRCVRGVLSGAVTSETDETEADAVKNKEAAQAEKARAARAARARELAKRNREPITLD